MPDGVGGIGDVVVAQASVEDIGRVEIGLVQGSRVVEVHLTSNSVNFTLIIVYKLHYVKRVSKSFLVGLGNCRFSESQRIKARTLMVQP